MRDACANDNASPRTMPALDESLRGQFVAIVGAATLEQATHVLIPLRIAQSVVGQLRFELGGLIDG